MADLELEDLRAKWKQEENNGPTPETQDLPISMPPSPIKPQGFTSNKPIVDKNNARVKYLVSYNAELLTSLYSEFATLNTPNGRCEGRSAIYEFWATYLEEHKPFSDSPKSKALASRAQNLTLNNAKIVSEDCAESNLTKWFYRENMPVIGATFYGTWIKQGNEWFISEETYTALEINHQQPNNCCNLI